MAEVTPTTASGTKQTAAKRKIFGEQKQPDLIVYRLLNKNPRLREDTPEYPPYKRFPNYDIIAWEYKNEDGSTTLGTRAIRWLPGFGSIFVDEQEAGNRVIPDNVLNNPNNRFEIIDGYIKVRPHERTKIQFLDYCNRNADSPYRTGTSEPLFARYSEQKVTEQKAERQAAQRLAIEKSFKADEEQIAFHAKYLGIALTDSTTGASRTLEAVTADYRQMAIDNPTEFLKTFDDEDLKLKYRIERAISENFINLKLVPGKAVFTGNKAEICEVPVGGDMSYIVDAIFNHAQGKSGNEFLKIFAQFGK